MRPGAHLLPAGGKLIFWEEEKIDRGRDEEHALLQFKCLFQLHMYTLCFWLLLCRL